MRNELKRVYRSWTMSSLSAHSTGGSGKGSGVFGFLPTTVMTTMSSMTATNIPTTALPRTVPGFPNGQGVRS
jgi:hypothetical protein